MTHSTMAPRRTKPLHRQLIARHFRQIIIRSNDEHDQLCDQFALTFLPGNRTNCFSEPLRTLGQGVMVCLTYGRHEKTGRRTMPICGFRARLSQDGFLIYGGENSLLFHHDAAYRLSVRSRRRPINPQHNPVLAEIAVRMDRACQRALGRTRWLPSVPQLPQVMLGFPLNQPPEFEDTNALRELAAFEMNVPIEELGCNGEMLLQRFLRDLWDRQLMHPGDPANTTGAFLISTEYCTQPGKALRAYEDYSSLLNAHSWNPARRVRPLTIPNPAAAILKEFGIENLEELITDEELEAMVSALRRAVGRDVPLTESEAFDAIANAHEPLQAWSPVLGELRALLEPAVAETVTDDDLLRAAAVPANPLIASRGCKIQVLQRHTSNDSTALRFPPEDLCRRAEVNLCVQR